jgi:hypothetical protein
VSGEIPTVAVATLNAKGESTSGLDVRLDGRSSAELSSGRSVAVDPGPHTIEAVTPSGDVVSQNISIVQGQKNQLFKLHMPEMAPSHGGTAGSTLGPAFWISAGSAAGLLAGSITLGLMTQSDLEALRETCAPNCSAAQEQDIQTRFLVADVLAGGALVAAGFAAYFWYQSPGRRPTDGTASTLRLTPTWGGARASLRF